MSGQQRKQTTGPTRAGDQEGQTKHAQMTHMQIVDRKAPTRRHCQIAVVNMLRRRRRSRRTTGLRRHPAAAGPQAHERAGGGGGGWRRGCDSGQSAHAPQRHQGVHGEEQTAVAARIGKHVMHIQREQQGNATPGRHRREPTRADTTRNDLKHRSASTAAPTRSIGCPRSGGGSKDGR